MITTRLSICALFLCSVALATAHVFDAGFYCHADPNLCSRHGICDSSGHYCICDEGWVSSGGSAYQCDRKVTSKLNGIADNARTADSMTGFNCTFAPEDCSNHGVCNRNNDGCICFDKYATHDAPVGVQCNYERKNHWIAFGLSWIGGAGAPYWYMEDYTMGILNLMFGVGGVCSVGIISLIGLCIASCLGNAEEYEERSTSFFKVFRTLICMCTFVWCLVLLFQTGLNTIPDGNGVDMY